MKPLPPAVLVLATGLFPLIPLPFFDDWLIARVRRRLIEERLIEAGVALAPRNVAQLAADPGVTLNGCLWAIVLWPLKKLLRMVLFFLMAKSCLDTAAETAHRLELLADALDAGAVPDEVDAVLAAISATLDEETPSPVKRALRRELELATVEGATLPDRLVTWLHLQGGGRAIRARFAQELVLARGQAQSTPTV